MVQKKINILMGFHEIIRVGYDSPCDPWTLMNSLKSADENIFADRAVSFKSLKGLLLRKEEETCAEFQHPKRLFANIEGQ